MCCIDLNALAFIQYLARITQNYRRSLEPTLPTNFDLAPTSFVGQDTFGLLGGYIGQQSQHPLIPSAALNNMTVHNNSPLDFNRGPGSTYPGTSMRTV